ncbi:MAG TPA: magnesium/cobalt transporter CorA, partial [Candidatus Hypogeohydataceae bacterium YC41]
PGTLIHIGEKKTEEVKIRIIDYDETQFLEKEVKTVEECLPFKDTPTVTWIDIIGIHRLDIIEKVGSYFGLHPLTAEDILNTDQRPKMEDFGNYLYVVLKILFYNDKKNEIVSEQISVIVGQNFVISFQEIETNIFNPLIERIRTEKGHIRRLGADYLAYSLLDSIIDNYFVILEKLGENIELLEVELVTHPTHETLHTLHNLKREMIFLRKSVWPLREVINGMQRGESSLIKDSTRIYLRDVYDHTIQVIDSIETSRDMLSGMLDIYLSSISNRLNAVMKVLTVIATIFMPLTFLVGVYGMNFKYMPELEWKWGYFAVLGVIAIIAISMLICFRKKKWL